MAAQASGEAAKPAAYFTSLSLENVRCFGEKQTLDLSDGKGGPARWTILLGENGTGKTTVLQALALMGWRVERVVSKQERGEPQGSSRDSSIPPTPPYFDAKTFPRTVWADAVVSATFAPFVRADAQASPFGYWLHMRTRGALSESESGPAPGTGTVTGLPVWCAYGAGRRLEPLLAEEVGLDDRLGTLFSGLASLRDAERWILNLDHTASKPSPVRDRQEQRWVQIKDLFCAILPEVRDLRVPVEAAAFPKLRVEFQTHYGWVPLRSLGYGYQTLIAWMVDLASRLVERYPNSPNPLAEPVIVLVDEIDLHLHPKWQRQLVGELTRRFPAAQFIVTAHSPLVVQAAEDANLAVLRREGDHVVIDNDVDQIRNWRIDQIYTSELFGLPSARPPRFDAAMKRREEILSKPALTEADEKELASLGVGDEPVGDSPAEMRTLRLIQESLELLKQGASKP